MSNPDVLAHIARLESELLRIQGELAELRARVRGTPSARRTQTFAAMVNTSKVDPREAVTRELPAQSEARITRPERPQPSVPVQSETVPSTKSDRRVPINRRTGLTEFPPADSDSSPPPATHPSTGRRAALADPGAGRYEYYDESSGKTQRRR